MLERRVVVTGVGVVSPIGYGYEQHWTARCAGHSGVAQITLFDPGDYAVQLAAEVKGFSDELVPGDPRYYRVQNRAMKLGLAAAGDCLRHAMLDDYALRADTACLASVGRHDGGILEFGDAAVRAMDPSPAPGEPRAFDRSRYLTRGVRAMHPLWLLTFIPNLAVAHIGLAFGLRGEANTYTSEAAGGLQVIGDAVASIREGLYERALVGGCDSRVVPVSVARYHSNGFLANARADETDLSMPFDTRRRGYVMGEGAAYLLLEDAAAAERRGARALAEVAGWGGASDAFHPTSAHPEGRGLANAMGRALARANAGPDDVDLVVAAAASLRDYDAAEARALERVFGSRSVAVTAPASAIGRPHSAAGSFAAVDAISALATQRIAPTINSAELDSDAPAGLVRGTNGHPSTLRFTLANGYSFGGQCASVLFREVPA